MRLWRSDACYARARVIGVISIECVCVFVRIVKKAI